MSQHRLLLEFLDCRFTVPLAINNLLQWFVDPSRMTYPLDNPITPNDEGTGNPVLVRCPHVSIVGPIIFIQCQTILDHIVPCLTAGPRFGKERRHDTFLFSGDSDEPDFIIIFLLQCADVGHPG